MAEWEVKSSENSPNEFKMIITQAKNYLQHLVDGSALDLQDNNNNININNTQSANGTENNTNGHNEYSDISDHEVDEETTSAVEENADPEEYARLFQLVHDQKAWLEQKVREIQQHIETGTYPYLKTDLRKYLS